ncbi:hypothetical protein H9Q73_000155 [Fusarium xylarioides]|nr:hypothetical protein H9Q73_000155 [Fusarium xylarioides]
MEESDQLPTAQSSGLGTAGIRRAETTRFRFGTRTITATGESSDDVHPNVLHQTFTSLADHGAYHDDMKLNNFHLVTDQGKDKIMAVNLESVEFDLSGEDLATVAKGSTDWIIEQYENHLECMELDSVILPKRALRTLV